MELRVDAQGRQIRLFRAGEVAGELLGGDEVVAMLRAVGRLSERPAEIVERLAMASEQAQHDADRIEREGVVGPALARPLRRRQRFVMAMRPDETARELGMIPRRLRVQGDRSLEQFKGLDGIPMFGGEHAEQEIGVRVGGLRPHRLKAKAVAVAVALADEMRLGPVKQVGEDVAGLGHAMRQAVGAAAGCINFDTRRRRFCASQKNALAENLSIGLRYAKDCGRAKTSTIQEAENAQWSDRETPHSI